MQRSSDISTHSLSRIKTALDQRQLHHRYRTLKSPDAFVDFCSNDYLGLSRSAWIRQKVELQSHSESLGSTGSRLLTGQSARFEELENYLAQTYQSEAALLFNSGFDANMGLLSTLIRPGDVVFYDAAIHASMLQGLNLAGATAISFAHNDTDHLKALLMSHTSEQEKWILCESYYSMDGDKALMDKLVSISYDYQANIIVDEAHALGCFGHRGRGLCMDEAILSGIFARVVTFGKGMGCHGAAVLCSEEVKNYLINFCKAFIYTTALPDHALAVIQAAHEFTARFVQPQQQLHQNIAYFTNLLKGQESLKGEGPVFAWLIPGEQAVRQKAALLQAAGLDVRPIVYPTVSAGTERLRISIHSFNTVEEMDTLARLLVS
jgi:8-amino-7-oxononanoate synthase